MDLEKTSISERELVCAAAIDMSARALLKRRVSTLVEEAVHEFMRLHHIPAARAPELLVVGMTPFETTFDLYVRRKRLADSEEGHFYAYYIWWMRQALVEHLGA